MPNGWNLADLWECIADRIPDALALQHADRSLTWREMDRRADALAAALLETGVARAGQGRALPLQLVRVHREPLRSVQGGAGAAEHELPLWRRRARLPVGQRRRGRRHLPRRVRRAASTALRHRVPRVRTWWWVDDGSGPCPAWATPYESAASTPVGSADGSAVGPQRRSPAAPLHGGHDRYAERGDVATGRSRRRAGRDEQAPAPARAGPRRRRGADREARPAQPAGGAADARHRAVQRDRQPHDRRLDRRRCRVATSMSSSCSTRCKLERVNSMSIVGDAFAKPILRAARCRARAVGHLEPAGHPLQRRHVERRDQGGPAAPQRSADHGRRTRLVGSDRHGDEHDDGRRRQRHGDVPTRAEHRESSPRTGVDVRPGSGELGRVALRGSHADRVLQGPREVGVDVPGDRRACATRSPATGRRSPPTAR